MVRVTSATERPSLSTADDDGVAGAGGMPPHIAELVAGHRDINVTMGYKAVYPEEVINGHRAFITRRRVAESEDGRFFLCNQCFRRLLSRRPTASANCCWAWFCGSRALIDPASAQ